MVERKRTLESTLYHDGRWEVIVKVGKEISSYRMSYHADTDGLAVDFLVAMGNVSPELGRSLLQHVREARRSLAREQRRSRSASTPPA